VRCLGRRSGLAWKGLTVDIEPLHSTRLSAHK
jgi:hypothetical protein